MRLRLLIDVDVKDELVTELAERLDHQPVTTVRIEGDEEMHGRFVGASQVFEGGA